MPDADQLYAQPLNQMPHADDVKPLSAADLPVLRDIRDVLARHGMLNRFGVTLLHKHFDLSPDEILVEATDPDTRTTVIKPGPRTRDAKTLETAWMFSGLDATGRPLIACHLVCHWNGPNHQVGHDYW